MSTKSKLPHSKLTQRISDLEHANGALNQRLKDEQQRVSELELVIAHHLACNDCGCMISIYEQLRVASKPFKTRGLPSRFPA